MMTTEECKWNHDLFCVDEKREKKTLSQLHIGCNCRFVSLLVIIWGLKKRLPSMKTTGSTANQDPCIIPLEFNNYVEKKLYPAMLKKVSKTPGFWLAICGTLIDYPTNHAHPLSECSLHSCLHLNNGHLHNLYAIRVFVSDCQWVFLWLHT